MKYYSVINKEWSNSICNNMDEPRDHHTKWTKSDKEGQKSLISGVQKKDTKELTKQKQIYTHRKQTYGGGREILRVWD